MTKKETMEAAILSQGCLGKADDDEPLFVLRGNDALAPEAVRHWADMAADAGTPPDKVSGARVVADQMQAWAETRGSKIPD